MSFCLLPDKVEEFRKALKEKEIKISDLLNMTTEARTALLEKYAGDNAKALNTAFEEKLVLKNRILGIQNWASKTGEIGKYSALGKEELAKSLSEYKAKQQERIFSPKEHEAFLNDLADKRVGTHISKEVAQKVFELSAKADSLKDVNPKLSGVSDEYLLAKNELNKYVDSQKPISAGASIGKNLSTIGRNNLLLNPSTPIKTSIGQVINTTMDMVTRRLGSLSLGGANGELVAQANKEAWDTFRKTGDNTAAMESLDNTGKLGEKHNFDITNAGVKSSNPLVRGIESTIRTVAKISNKVAIDWEHNIPFTKFHQKAFFDMTNIMSSNIAKSEGLSGSELKGRAGEIFKDAARIEPQTKEGAIVRMEAQKQAARVTSTNDTLLGNLTTSVKNALNKATPKFPLGDILMPIAKIPANIIYNGIENAGLGIPLGVKDIFEGRAKIQSTDLATRYQGMAQFADGIQKVGRTVGVLGAAALFTSQLKKEDFRSDIYGAHFVKIGNVWINTEYINAISPSLAGMMEVKQKAKSGEGIVEKAGHYFSGAVSGLASTPGIDEPSKLVKAITNANFTKGIQKYGSDFFNSRGKPVFISNLLKDRPIERLFFGATGVETPAQVHQDSVNAKKKK